MNGPGTDDSSPTVTPRRDGTVTVEGDGRLERWHPWDAPGGGFRVEGARKGRGGELRPLLLGKLLDGHLDRLHPLVFLSATVPEMIRRMVLRAQAYGYERLRLAQLNPSGFLRMARRNPALLMLAAESAARCPLWGEAYWAAVLDLPPADAAERMGLRRRAASVCAKIAAYAGNDTELIREVCARPRLFKILSHVPRIGNEHLLLCAARPEIVARSPALLTLESPDDTAGILDGSQIPSPRSFVERILRCRAGLGREPWPYRNEIADIRILANICDRLEREFALERAWPSGFFPETAVGAPPGFKRIRESEELRRAAEVYGNCLFSYDSLCRAGLVDVYEFHDNDDRYVVLLEQRLRRWYLAAAERTANRPVDAACIEKIRACFGLPDPSSPSY